MRQVAGCPWSCRCARRLTREAANIQTAPTAARLYALPPQAAWLWGEANGSGANASRLNIKSITARSREARTSRTAESIATPASTKATPVSIVQKSPPKGIHFGTMAETNPVAAKCAKPKSMELNPKTQRMVRGTFGNVATSLVPGEV